MWVKEKWAKRCHYLISPRDWTKRGGMCPSLWDSHTLTPSVLPCASSGVCAWVFSLDPWLSCSEACVSKRVCVCVRDHVCGKTCPSTDSFYHFFYIFLVTYWLTDSNIDLIRTDNGDWSLLPLQPHACSASHGHLRIYVHNLTPNIIPRCIGICTFFLL